MSSKIENNIKPYICTVVNNTNLVKINAFRMTPQHSQHKVVGRRDWLVNVFKVHIQKILQNVTNNIIIVT